MTHDEQKPVREAFEKWYTEKYLGVNIGDAFVRLRDGYTRIDVDYVWLGYQAATTRESELLAVIRAMDAALRYVEAHYDGMEKADIVSKAIRLAEQVV